MLRALIWDVDGTLAETERDGHRVAFNLAFQQLGLPWRWSVQRYGALLAVTGGRERLIFDMATRRHAPTGAEEREALAREVHELKNRFYAELVSEGQIALRPGVRRLMEECASDGIAMAIATTTSEGNIDALLSQQLGPRWRDRFGAVIGAETAPRKKPDPLAYELACGALGLRPAQCLAIEDSPNGAAAATAAGVPVLVTRSAYFAHHTFSDALAECYGLDEPAERVLLHRRVQHLRGARRIELAALRLWHAEYVATGSVQTLTIP